MSLCLTGLRDYKGKDGSEKELKKKDKRKTRRLHNVKLDG